MPEQAVGLFHLWTLEVRLSIGGLGGRNQEVKCFGVTCGVITCRLSHRPGPQIAWDVYLFMTSTF